MRPKLISLDVWNTLVVADPEFARARDRLFVAELPMAFDDAIKVYRAHKDGADARAEAEGHGLSSAVTWKNFCADLALPDHYDWWRLRSGLEQVFAKHPPIVLPETIKALREVQAAGIHLSIGSNTNFIRGRMLHDISLGTWGVAWAFQLFSDEIEVAKPHPNFWHEVKAHARVVCGVEPTEILHIGDNLICDGGCDPHGISFRHTPNPAALPAILAGVLS